MNITIKSKKNPGDEIRAVANRVMDAGKWTCVEDSEALVALADALDRGDNVHTMAIILKNARQAVKNANRRDRFLVDNTIDRLLGVEPQKRPQRPRKRSRRKSA